MGPETYSEHRQTSKMEFFVKNDWRHLAQSYLFGCVLNTPPGILFIKDSDTVEPVLPLTLIKGRNINFNFRHATLQSVMKKSLRLLLNFFKSSPNY